MPRTLDTPLNRLLEPLAERLTPESARQLVDLQPDSGTQARIDELAMKANEGTLSPDERAEYGEYVEAIDVISILREKARKVLAARGA